MKLSIDSFYYDNNYGVIKFKGRSDKGMLLFDRYEKSFITEGVGAGWHPLGQRINIDKGFMLKRIRNKLIKPILPPQ